MNLPALTRSALFVAFVAGLLNVPARYVSGTVSSSPRYHLRFRAGIRGQAGWAALLGLLFVAIFAADSLAAPRGPGRVAFYEEGKAPSCSFKVELALTPEEQAKGLMFRESLRDDAGMLFIFPRDEIRNFWMRNTLIPLDMIFVSSGLKVVSVHDFAKPRDETEISSGFPAKYVIEVNGGKATACRIKAGTKVKFISSSP